MQLPKYLILCVTCVASLGPYWKTAGETSIKIATLHFACCMNQAPNVAVHSAWHGSECAVTLRLSVSNGTYLRGSVV